MADFSPFNGMVPGLDQEHLKTLTTGAPLVFIDENAKTSRARTYKSAADLISDLGLDPFVARTLETKISTELKSSLNELDFRRGLMVHMIEGRYDRKARREIMTRASNLWRSTHAADRFVNGRRVEAGTPGLSAQRKPSLEMPELVVLGSSKSLEPGDLDKSTPRGGTYHRRVPKPGGGYKYIYEPEDYAKLPDAHLDGEAARHQALLKQTRSRLEAAGGICHPHEFADLVRKHGHQLVARALREHADFDGETVNLKGVKKPKKAEPANEAESPTRPESKKTAVKKGDPEVMPEATPNAGQFKVGQPNPSSDPVGTRKVWNKRVVEKLADGKWHVVGHIAGLEDPGRVPQLDPKLLDPEVLRDLIAKVRSHEEKTEHAKKPVPPAPPKKDK